MSCKLIHGDCLTEMEKLIDNGVIVDMILTDPPYLMNYHSGRIKDKTHDFRTPIMNDNNPQLLKQAMPLLKQLLKVGVQCICSVIVTR